MSEDDRSRIGLADFIAKVKRDLLSPPAQEATDPPILFVESVELELQVTVQYEGKAGIKVDVVSVGSGELGGGASRHDVHTVKVTLSPLFDKAQLLDWYKELHPDDWYPAIKEGMTGLMKGPDDNLADRY